MPAKVKAPRHVRLGIVVQLSDVSRKFGSVEM